MKDVSEIVAENFAVRLRKKMQEKDIRTGELALVVGVSSQGISRYLSGNIVPGVIVVKKIAEAIGCSMDDLICLEEQ